MKEIFGAVKGRHNLPVEKYIFNESIKDVTDVKKIDKKVAEELNGVGELVLYVTGRTVVTTAVCKFCFENRIPLTLKHFDAQNNGYFEQVVIS